MNRKKEAALRFRVSRSADGFTLIEILVVIVIIGLLASVVGPNIVGKLGGAKIKTAKLQIDDLGAALDLYYLEIGQYPSSEQGLTALIQAPSGVVGWQGPYLKKNTIPRDPWGHDYQYRAPGEHGAYDLWSLGADGKLGGEGDDADLQSWD